MPMTGASSTHLVLIPGDNQVTVMWQQSPSETVPDPFFGVATAAIVGGSVNPLSDPNYRDFDVEGYRIYRGRVTAPNDLTMLSQLDYTGTVLRAYGDQLTPPPRSAQVHGAERLQERCVCSSSF